MLLCAQYDGGYQPLLLLQVNTTTHFILDYPVDDEHAFFSHGLEGIHSVVGEISAGSVNIETICECLTKGFLYFLFSVHESEQPTPSRCRAVSAIHRICSFIDSSWSTLEASEYMTT